MKKKKTIEVEFEFDVFDAIKGMSVEQIVNEICDIENTFANWELTALLIIKLFNNINPILKELCNGDMEKERQDILKVLQEAVSALEGESK